MGVIPLNCASHGREGRAEWLSKIVFPLLHYIVLQNHGFSRYLNCSSVVFFAIGRHFVQGFAEVSRRTSSRMVVAVEHHNGCVCICWYGEIPNFKSVRAESTRTWNQGHWGGRKSFVWIAANCIGSPTRHPSHSFHEHRPPFFMAEAPKVKGPKILTSSWSSKKQLNRWLEFLIADMKMFL